MDTYPLPEPADQQTYRLNENAELLALHLRYIRENRPEDGRELTRIYSPVVWQTVGRLDISDLPFDDPEDAASTGFIGLGHALRKFDADKAGGFLGYLYRYVWGVIQNEVKRRRRLAYAASADFNPDWQPDPKPGPAESLLREEFREEFVSLTADLAPGPRAVIRLAVLDGLSNSQIADELGRRVAVVVGWHQAAEHSVRDLLDA